MTTNWPITNANGETWTIQSQDNAAAGRVHDMAFFLETNNATQMAGPRVGVLCAGSPGTGTAPHVPTAFQVSASGTGLGMLVQPGSAVTDASPSRGGYSVGSRVVASCALDPASTTITRIDRVDLQVLDGAVGENGGTSLTRILVTTGTASIAAAPINSIPLAVITLPPNTVTLTSAMIADVRKSTGLRGGVRPLLPGDNMSDAGAHSGELRDTVVKNFPASIDRWNPATSSWTTIVDLGGAAPSQQLNVAAMGSSTSTTYVVPANTAAVTFQAPISGIVALTWAAQAHTAPASLSAAIVPEVRTGSTVGSGTLVFTANDNNASQVISATASLNQTCNGNWLLSGLTPGAMYNARLMWRVAAGTTTIAGANPYLAQVPYIP